MLNITEMCFRYAFYFGIHKLKIFNETCKSYNLVKLTKNLFFDMDKTWPSPY